MSHLEKNYRIDHKFTGKLPVKHSFAMLKFSKKGKVQELLHNLKYRNKPELASYLGALYGKELAETQLDLDMIVGVPLHPKRQKERGYNQADEFAKGLSSSLGLSFEENVIRRTRETDTQTNKSRFDRFMNMKDVFLVEKPQLIKGKRVALADDVITTGSTLVACGEELLDAGVKELSIIAIASAL